MGKLQTPCGWDMAASRAGRLPVLGRTKKYLQLVVTRIGFDGSFEDDFEIYLQLETRLPLINVSSSLLMVSIGFLL